MSRDIEKVLQLRELVGCIRQEYDLQQLTQIKLKMLGQSSPLGYHFSRVWDLLCFGTTEIFIGEGRVGGFLCVVLLEGCERGGSGRKLQPHVPSKAAWWCLRLALASPLRTLPPN